MPRATLRDAGDASPILWTKTKLQHSNFSRALASLKSTTCYCQQVVCYYLVTTNFEHRNYQKTNGAGPSCPLSSLKYGFHNKSFILNAPLVSCPIPVIPFGWVCCCTYLEGMTGTGQLTRGAFRINDFKPVVTIFPSKLLICHEFFSSFFKSKKY